jgi:hypothetical protein
MHLADIWHWFTYPVHLDRARKQAEKNEDIFRDVYHETREMLFAREAELKALRAQLVQLRVAPAVERRAGWEVMAFIPEEVLDAVRGRNALFDADWEHLIKRITVSLVDYAIKGIYRVRANGKVTALIFGPVSLHSPADAPRMVEALFDKDGKFKTSQDVWDQQDEEARVRRAAGCESFGV